MQEIKNRKNVARFNNEIVEKNLLKFEQKLTINQQKVLYYLIIQEKNGQSLQGISWNNLQERLGISSGEKYDLKRKKNFLKDVQKAQLGVVIDEKNMEFHTIFPSIGLRYNKFYYTINPEITSLFDQPELGYYLTNYEYYKEFKHDYSIKLYELLNKELSANDKEKRNYKYVIKDLREYLGVENVASYENFPNFRRIVLEPSLKEINDLTDISIEGALNPKTKKMQLSSKAWGEDVVFIRGISRKTTVQEYVQEQFDNAIIAKEEGRTKINKEPKLGEETIGVEKCKEIVHSFGEYGHVKFNEEQFYKSKDLFESTDEFQETITLLDEYFEQNPDKRYKNHYIAMKKMKKILEKQKIQTPNNAYKTGEPIYEEPVYEVADTTEVANMSEEEAKALLENPFGKEKVVEKNEVTSKEFVNEVVKSEAESSKLEVDPYKSISKIPGDLFSEVENLYFWYLEKVESLEKVDEKIKEFEKIYDYNLSGREKIKIYKSAKHFHDENNN